jgi:hypothetical protein
MPTRKRALVAITAGTGLAFIFAAILLALNIGIEIALPTTAPVWVGSITFLWHVLGQR